MQYPSISEYINSIRNSDNTLNSLKHLTPVLDKQDEPLHINGKLAVVFKMYDKTTNKYYALKCFTKDKAGRSEAYHMISDELDTIDSPYFTSVIYIEDELFVDNNNCERLPVLLMDWVDGVTMNIYIHEHFNNTYAMAMLNYRFCRMAAWLRTQPLAHGAIKPDNIIVRGDGSLVLVDYDEMYVPQMRDIKYPTTDNHNFNHPKHTVDDWNETIDDFALACIALSLKAISLDETLYTRHKTSDSLILSNDDYQYITQSKAIYDIKELLYDNELATIYGMFMIAYAHKNLKGVSYKLFYMGKPIEIEDTLISAAEPTDDELTEAFIDKYGVKYSKDGKRLLKAPEELEAEYVVRSSTRIICNSAFKSCKALTHITLPEKLITIGDSAFYGCKALTSIELPGGITTINNSTFYYCEHLVKINLPIGLTVIEDSAFYSCKALTSIKLPSTLISIGSQAFSWCESLTNINIPDGVTAIKRQTFEACRVLNDIKWSKKLTSIGYQAFWDCKGLTNIIFPNSLKTIGEEAFKFCRSLSCVDLPSGLTTIAAGAFYCCSSLTKIHLPLGVTTIENQAFIGCESLISVELSNSTEIIGNLAFGHCYKLSSIVIPNGVKTIGNYAFYKCRKVSSIELPRSLKEIKDNPFAYTQIHITSKSPHFLIENNILYTADKKTLIAYLSTETEFTIPTFVAKVATAAFRGCQTLTKVILPNDLTQIETSTFEGCNSLTCVTFPTNLTTIYECAFTNCKSLTSINLPDKLNHIGKFAFANCHLLADINLPDSLTYIGSSAFNKCNLPKELTEKINNLCRHKGF